MPHARELKLELDNGMNVMTSLPLGRCTTTSVSSLSRVTCEALSHLNTGANMSALWYGR